VVNDRSSSVVGERDQRVSSGGIVGEVNRGQKVNDIGWKGWKGKHGSSEGSGGQLKEVQASNERHR